jgi:hypothetical protein
MQSKRKSKVHPLAGGWEESNRNTEIGILRTQAFLVVCTDGDDYSRQMGLCVINSRSVTRYWWLKPVILIVRLSMGHHMRTGTFLITVGLLKTLHMALKNNKHSPLANS